jgi:SAM-dependent methyltransferase
LALFGKMFSKSPAAPATLNRWQSAFVRWNAERLGITEDESRERYRASLGAVDGGHGGREFRRFCETAHEVYRVLWSDAKDEVLDAYAFHAPMHFLRMLGYPDHVWPDDDPILVGLRETEGAVIADYGCGLAQRSLTLAHELGRGARVVLVDIPTIRKDFLGWLAKDLGVGCTFVDVTADAPFPDLPPCDACIAEQVFEHIYDPMRAFETIHAALAPGGWLETNVADHKEEFMHVTPRLGPLRDRIASLGYETIEPDRLLRKPA